MEDSFSMDWGRGVVSEWFKHITFIVHFISIIFTSSAGLRSQGLHAQSCPTTLAGPWTVAPTPCIPCPLSPPALRTPSGSCLGLSGLQRLETCKVKILRKLPPAPVIHAQACHSHRQRVPTPGPGPLKMPWKWQRPSSSQDARAVTASPQKHTNSFVFIHSTSEQISVILMVLLRHRSRPWGCNSGQNTRSLWWSERGLTIYKWLPNCQMEVSAGKIK